MKKIKEAVSVLSKALKEDNDYYYGWQSNIAMAFKDEYNRNRKNYMNSDDIHKVANEAAKNFLNLLIK